MNIPGPIYCIGDSHINFFSGQNKAQSLWPKPSNDILPYFRTFRLGAILAYNLCEYGTRKKGRELLFALLDRDIPLQSRVIPPEHKVLLCFGEIDCRAHLLKQSELKKKDLSTVVKECAERYFSVILEIDKLGYEVFVWNVIPSSKYDHIPNKEFPTFGTCLERNRATLLFNDSLSSLCSSSNVQFISIFGHLVDKKGLTRMEYYYDHVHLSQKAMPLALDRINPIVGGLNSIKDPNFSNLKRKYYVTYSIISHFFTHFRDMIKRPNK